MSNQSVEKFVPFTFTLARACKFSACKDGYNAVAEHLGGEDAYGIYTPFDVLVVLEHGHSPLSDTFWCMYLIEESQMERSRKLVALFQVWCLDRLMKEFDKRAEDPDYDKDECDYSDYRDELVKISAVLKRFVKGETSWEEVVESRKKALELFYDTPSCSASESLFQLIQSDDGNHASEEMCYSLSEEEEFLVQKAFLRTYLTGKGEVLI